MVHDGSNWLMKTRRAALILSAAFLPLMAFAVSAVHAQGIMRTPNLNLGARTPSINPTITPRINPGVAAARPSVSADRVARTPPTRIGTMSSTLRVRPGAGVQSTLPYARFSPNLYPACEYAFRGPDGECFDRPVVSAGGGDGTSAKKGKGGSSNNNAQAAVNLRAVKNELVAEIDGALSTADADELARRHGLERIASQSFPLLGGTIGLFRIVDNRPVDTVRRELAADGSVRSVQLNFRHFLQDQKKPATEGDAAQYAVAQLRLPQAHTLVRGMNVTVAVIDSGVDVKHPELANSVADSFDALGSACPRHRHCRRDCRACQADGQRAGGEIDRDPCVRRRIEGRGEYVLRDPQGIGLCGRAWRTDRQHELCRPEGPADRAGDRRHRSPWHPDGGCGRQCRREIAAALSGRQSERDRGERNRRAGKTVCGVEPG
jgi:subtilisin family serine protease